jgi:O-antigen/teichoic acid export membrane protein
VKERSFSANSLLSVGGWFIPAVALFVCTPIIVRGLGNDAYGLWVLVTALTGFLGLMDLGLGQAIIRYLSFYRALSQGRPMIDIVRFAVRWFGFAGAIGGILLIAGAPWLVHVLHIAPGLRGTATIIFRLAGINFFLGMLISVGAAIPQSFLRYDLVGGANAFFGAGTTVVAAVLVKMGYGVVAMMVFYIVANALAMVVYAAMAWRLFRTVPLDVGPTWREIRRKTLSFAGVTAITRIHTVVAAQANRLVVGAANGTAAATFYQVPNLIASNVGTMTTRAAVVLFPTGAELIARNDHATVRALYLRTSRLFFLINATANTALCALAVPLLAHWVGPQYAQKGALALVVFAIAQTVNIATMAGSFLNLSAARPGINLAFSAANSGINLMFVYPLAVRYGVTGAALAGLLGTTTVPFFIHYVDRHVVMVSSWTVLRSAYLPTIVGATACGTLAYFFMAPLCSTLMITLLVWCLVCAVALAVCGLLGAVSRADMRTARRLLSSLRRRPAESGGET